MRTYILRRLLALVPTLFIASVIVFVTVRLIPGDVIDLMLSQNDLTASSRTREQLIAARGRDKPMWEPYLHGISRIVLHGDMGPSLWRGTPVVPSGLSWLGPALGVSLVLAAIVYGAAALLSRQ